jgi:hypothetical protein
VSRRYAVQRVSAGLSADEFEQRRADLLSLLDAVERRGTDALRSRVVPLRRRLVSLRPGVGLVELERARRQRQKDLARLLVEQELQQSGGDREDPPAQDASLDARVIERRLGNLQADLRRLERTPRMNLATTSGERDDRINALKALFEPCAKCHESTASGVRLSAVRIAEPVMPRSIFNHAPHTTETSCDTCHRSVVSSEVATDVNVPGVETCRTCHAPAKARAECETCHVYHPPSAVTLLRSAP